MFKKNSFSIFCLLLVLTLTACGGANFINENGHKKFRDSQGNFVTNDWVKIKNDYYYFDMNGYLVTDDWIEDEYYVDRDGRMVTNLWKDHNGVHYYLKSDGKYARDEVLDIEGSKYAFDENGVLKKNSIALDYRDSKFYFFADDGKAFTKHGFYPVGDTYVYIKNDGSLLVKDWVEEDGKWYYLDENGFMLKSSLVEGGFYVDENGEMVKNKEVTVNNRVYVFDENGHGAPKQNKSAGSYSTVMTTDLKQLYQLYCHPAHDASSTAYYKFAYLTNDNKKLEFLGKAFDYQIMIATAEKINSALGVPHVTASMRNTTPAMGLQKQIVSTNLEISWSVTDETTTSGSKPSIWIQYKKY